MPAVVQPYARRTNRLAFQQRQVGFATSGEAGARLLADLGMPTSPSTLLRLIKDAPQPAFSTPRVLGVDDWAFRRGQSYGTILPWSARRAAWLLFQPENEANALDKQTLERIQRADKTIVRAYSLTQRFVSMIKQRQPKALVPWLSDVAQSGIEILVHFAKGLKQDLSAVTNALRLPWSQGQVEGQVNRLKLIKRKRYGRANFDLLRKRVLGF